MVNVGSLARPCVKIFFLIIKKGVYRPYSTVGPDSIPSIAVIKGGGGERRTRMGDVLGVLTFISVMRIFFPAVSDPTSRKLAGHRDQK